jgi:tetratricopeptide (TPR) repeat protein
MSSPFTPPEADQEIAPPSTLELLWINHRGALLGGIIGLTILTLIALGVLAVNRSARIASENLLSGATNDAAWNEVISKYPRTPAAADAMLLLAASLRDAGKIEESDSLYSRFTETYPSSPLAVSGLIGRASNARVAGKPGDALNSYQQAAAAYPQSYGAPFAIFSQARLLAQQGRMEDARRVIQSLGTQYPNSVSAQAAGVAAQLPGQPQN